MFNVIKQILFCSSNAMQNGFRHKVMSLPKLNTSGNCCFFIMKM